MPATLQTSTIDLWSDDVLNDPYPAFTELREQAAAVYLEPNDVWVITRYKEIRDALADWETFTSTKVAFNEKTNEVLTGTTLASDPPLHTTLRAALRPRFSVRTTWNPNSSAIAGVASVDPSSTTITSTRAESWASTLSRAAGRNAAAL